MSTLMSILRRQNSEKAKDEKSARTRRRMGPQAFNSNALIMHFERHHCWNPSISGASSGFPWRARRTDRLYVGGINQRARLGVLKQLVIAIRNADSRRLNTTIYTHVPLHDIDSIQRDERFIRSSRIRQSRGGKLNERGEIRYSNASSDDRGAVRVSLANHELQSDERFS